VNVCCDLQEELKNNTQFLIKAVTGDKIWCYGYNPESKQHSISGSHQICTEPPPEKEGVANLLKCQDHVDLFF